MPDYGHMSSRPDDADAAGKGQVPAAAIVVTQKNPAALAAAHSASHPAVIPQIVMMPAASFRFTQISATEDIHEFLFEGQKGGAIFWVGAAVPKGTTDLLRAQVFFHPTVVQNGVVHAADGDYRAFKGGWSCTNASHSSFPMASSPAVSCP